MHWEKFLSMSFPAWAQWMLRIAGWAAWQFFVLVFAFLVYVNLFGEYGVYHHPIVVGVAAVVFLVLTLFLGTLPIRRWRDARPLESRTKLCRQRVTRGHHGEGGCSSTAQRSRSASSLPGAAACPKLAKRAIVEHTFAGIRLDAD